MAKRAASFALALGVAGASSLLSCHEEAGQGYPPAMAPRTKVVATTTTISRRDEEALFSAAVARFLAGMLSYRPDMATSLGDHRFDGRWADLSEEGDAKLLTFFHGVADELSSIDAARL